jgi:hypothetical protein
MGEPGRLIDAFLATLWAMIGGPIIWVLATPRFHSQGSNSVLYGLGTAMVLAMAGFAITSHLIRRWRR